MRNPFKQIAWNSPVARRIVVGVIGWFFIVVVMTLTFAVLGSAPLKQAVLVALGTMIILSLLALGVSMILIPFTAPEMFEHPHKTPPRKHTKKS